MPFDDLAKTGLVFLQLAPVKNFLLCIAVQNVLDTRVLVIILDDSFTQFGFGRLEHLEIDNLISKAASPISE